jgi:DNA repair exonuclease SbcCD ATPase subunit
MTIDEQQAEIFMAYAKKRLKDNLDRIESMTPEEKIKQKRKEYAKRYYEKNKEICKERTKNHPSCKTAREKYRNKPETKQRIRNQKLLDNYGITNRDYEEMLENQGFCCDGCGTHQNELDKKLNVDHDHKTGTIRGLLCGNCNRALGLVKDNVETLVKLKKYLEKSYVS